MMESVSSPKCTHLKSHQAALHRLLVEPGLPPSLAGMHEAAEAYPLSTSPTWHQVLWFPWQKRQATLERREWQISPPQKPEQPFKMALECHIFWLETPRVHRHVHHCQFNLLHTSYWISAFMKCKNNWHLRTSIVNVLWRWELLHVQYFVDDRIVEKTSVAATSDAFRCLFHNFTTCIPCKCLT